jgi:hypothetical protein
MRTDATAKPDARDTGPTPRDIEIARVLRPLGTKPMTKEQAVRAGQLLGVHHGSGHFRGRKRSSSVVIAKRKMSSEPN